MYQANWFGKYRILKSLGKGGNSEVYLAEHIKLNSFRAIKFISKNHPLYDLQCNEALILKNLKHSCIPIIYDIEEDEEGSYIVEQYLEGETLRRHVMTKGPLREDVIIKFGLQLCDLIGYLHSIERPILFVDLKPDNIILSDMTLKLIDFGSAVFLDELSEQQGYFGTKGYAAPELYREGKVNHRCDVYGIGMLMYFMATGQDSCNTTGINHIDYIGKCSKNLKKVINNCLRYHASQRFISVAGLSKELSTMTRKNHMCVESSRIVKIAVAGAQPRVGVTHLGFRICLYLIGMGAQCLYQENNNSDCIRSIMNCYNEVEVKQGIHRINEIPMLPFKQQYTPDTLDFPYVVVDYGTLTESNLAEFLNADVKLVILGTKDWELSNAEQVIQMTAEYKEITYLFNYVDGRQFQQVLNSMGLMRCLRIPYEPDPYTKINQKNEIEFFDQLIQPQLRNSKKRIPHKPLRGEDEHEAKADTI